MGKRNLNAQDIQGIIRDIPDFPKPGIIFKDISTVLQNPIAFKSAVNLMAAKFKGKGVTKIVAVESRGFIFGSVLAYKLGAGFVIVRKKGKLPYKTRSISYELEYGTDTLEIHDDALTSKDCVLIVDDLLATGGTVEAVTKLIKAFKARIVGSAFLVELSFLKGRQRLRNLPILAIIKY
ncbi:MAG: adenine phosphoribosyltransferase [Candidatus Omnitrophica bacterium]|nr:adenine phosphoribosyltransferase [Candidatus Omnitrophota bacterium]